MKIPDREAHSQVLLDRPRVAEARRKEMETIEAQLADHEARLRAASKADNLAQVEPANGWFERNEK